MELHRFIRDKKQFDAFVEWLPELRHNECYYLHLKARKKYMPRLKSSDKTLLKRFVATKRNLAQKVAELECPIGVYRTRQGDIIGDEAIALYITLNPRCMRKAAYATAHSMLNELQNHDAQNTITLNPHSDALTQIHKSKARTSFVHFDIDMPTGDHARDAFSPKSAFTIAEIYAKTVEVVGQEAVEIIQTRGGCHVLVDPVKVACADRNWHPIITENLNVDQTGDLMVPVVGSCQGGFIPHFYLS